MRIRILNKTTDRQIFDMTWYVTKEEVQELLWSMEDIGEVDHIHIYEEEFGGPAVNVLLEYDPENLSGWTLHQMEMIRDRAGNLADLSELGPDTNMGNDH